MRETKPFRSTLPIVALFVPLLCACTEASAPAMGPGAQPVASVRIIASAGEIEVGQTVQLSAVAKDAAGNVLSTQTLSWRSSDPDVATVTEHGLVAARKTGQIVITVLAGTQTDSLALAIVPVPVAFIAISPTIVELAVGEARQMTAASYGRDGGILHGRSFVWSSSDTLVGHVSPGGLVKGVSRGQVVITAASEGKSGSAEAFVRQPLVLKRVEGLTPNRTATLVGASLDSVTALTAAGVPVEYRLLSDSVIAFDVPEFRSCDVDGRPVTVTANGRVQVQAKLQLELVSGMEIGESRVLDPTAGVCVSLPAADQDFVLSVINFSRRGAGATLNALISPDTLFVVRTYSEMGTEAIDMQLPEWPPTHFSAALNHVKHIEQIEVMAHAFWGPLSDNPIPFDPRYATAGVGDTVRFVDWTRANCQTPRDQAPWIEVEIVAAHGWTVIGVDLTDPNAPTYLTPTMKAVYQRGVELANDLMIPVMRQIFDREYVPLRGGGGRHFGIVRYLEAGGYAFEGGTGRLQSSCPLASEMTTTGIGGQSDVSIAGTLIHEYTHNADMITNARLTSRPRLLPGWLREAWPGIAHDVAGRIYTGQPTMASPSFPPGGYPANPGTLTSNLWGQNVLRSWSDWYSRNWSILHFAREWFGDATIQDSGPLLFPDYAARTLIETNEVAIEALGLSLATTTDELLDRWSLAAATQSLLPLSAAQSLGLPQMVTFDFSSYATQFGPRAPNRTGSTRPMPRTTDSSRRMVAGPGNYDVVYLLADDGRGISFELQELRETPMRVRLTRIR